jgi:hypothetical protein
MCSLSDEFHDEALSRETLLGVPTAGTCRKEGPCDEPRVPAARVWIAERMKTKAVLMLSLMPDGVFGVSNDWTKAMFLPCSSTSAGSVQCACSWRGNVAWWPLFRVADRSGGCWCEEARGSVLQPREHSMRNVCSVHSRAANRTGGVGAPPDPTVGRAASPESAPPIDAARPSTASEQRGGAHSAGRSCVRSSESNS